MKYTVAYYCYINVKVNIGCFLTVKNRTVNVNIIITLPFNPVCLYSQVLSDLYVDK